MVFSRPAEIPPAQREGTATHARGTPEPVKDQQCDLAAGLHRIAENILQMNSTDQMRTKEVSNTPKARTRLTHAGQCLTMPAPNWMDAQVDVTWAMRKLLVEYLVQVHELFDLRPATLFLAINILDRYCCRRMIDRHHYQLVGCVSFLVAVKFREPNERVPSLQDLSKLCESAYTVTELADKEWDLLDALQWTVDHPDPCTFIETRLASIHDPLKKHISMYVAEVLLCH